MHPFVWNILSNFQPWWVDKLRVWGSLLLDLVR